MTERRPVAWEVEWFARQGCRITRVVDYEEGRGTRYESTPDPMLRRALIDEADRERQARQRALF